jgi:carboxyl-terminal processing protease
MYVKRTKNLKRKMQNQDSKSNIECRNPRQILNSDTKCSRHHTGFFRFCFLVICIYLVFSASGFGFAGIESGNPAGPNQLSAKIAEVASEPNQIIVRICSDICKGDFAGVQVLLKEKAESQNPAFSQLADVVNQYESIEHSRQLAREAAYEEQLAELEKFRLASEANDVNQVGEANDVTQVGDANGIVKILLVVAKASEFANEQQRSKLLSDVFVKQTIEKAKAMASEFESKGKWLDAYLTCYSWLKAVDKDNTGYSEHAEQLIDKADIAASFQDSPCETSRERFKGIKEDMFLRAIDVLKYNYVRIFDYRQIATKAIKRCQLLVEVLNTLFLHDSQNENLVSWNEGAEGFSAPFDSKKLAAWSAGLAKILDEVDQSPTGMSNDKFVDVFKKVLALNEATIHLPRQVLIAHFAEAALSALDPYTVMVWPKQVQDFEKEMTNEFTGVGIEISRQNGLLTAVSLLPDTPAYNSGLDAGDVIEKVDGVDTKDMSLICAVRRITGPAGTKVTLTVRAPGENETREITITRAKIIVPTIHGWERDETGKWLYMVDKKDKIGYVRITNFSAETASDLAKVLDELESEGMTKGGLILDLRFNTGGLLDSAIQIADDFISKGLIVRTQPRLGIPTYASAREEGTRPDYPLVILINYSSASASEIVAGALADAKHHRAILVGSRTYGKGSVQGITPHPGGGAQLKYTMAYYHLPSGQRVESEEAMKKLGRDDWGVAPGVKVELRSDEMKKMFDVQRDNNVLVRADHDRGQTPLKKHSLGETLAADPQLAIGILIIKAELIKRQNMHCGM